MLAYQLAHAMKFFHLFGMKGITAKLDLKVLNFEQKKKAQMEFE